MREDRAGDARTREGRDSVKAAERAGERGRNNGSDRPYRTMTVSLDQLEVAMGAR